MDIVDPFHRTLHNLIAEKLSDRMAGLATGSASAIQGSTATVAENYAAQTSYIKALNDVLGWCVELELEQYGKRPTAEASE